VRIHLLAVGQRQPEWVSAGFRDYARRMPKECALALAEVPAAKRTRGTSPERALADEALRLRAAIPRTAGVVALDERGVALSTADLAHRLQTWLASGRDMALLIGGPDGLAPPIKEDVDLIWSLSPLTLPHGLVRVIVAEALYRAWSVIQRHPYHRAGGC
jgi:23S rRNA (pseudouridine1915-N3)-methyltransferase